jgi:hypothetical protein
MVGDETVIASSAASSISPMSANIARRNAAMNGASFSVASRISNSPSLKFSIFASGLD